MTVNNWYNPATHKSQSPNDLPQPTDATDVCALYDQHQHYTRERHVKIAHKRFIEDKLQRCFLYHGTHNFRQHCRHLMEEFRQTKDELTGWKEFSRVKNLKNLTYFNYF